MNFRAEWEQIKAETAASHTRLNSANASVKSGSGKDLVVNQDDLGAVGTDAYQLHDQLQRKADISTAGSSGAPESGSTDRAARELSRHNLAMGDELTLTAGIWNAQVKTIRQACAHISNHLDYSKKSYAKEEEKIEASMRQRDGSEFTVSQLSKWFK